MTTYSKESESLRYPRVTSLGILSPALTPVPSPLRERGTEKAERKASGSSGVSDHTARLVRHWTDAGIGVSVASDPRIPADAVVDDWARQGVTATLIQYVPFLYGRRGLSPYPERIAARARARGMGVVVFVHEPWVPLTRPQWLVLGPLQRIQLHRLVRRASAAVTAVPAWQSLVRPKAQLIYVGSTLPTSPLSPLPGGRGEPPGESTLPAPVVFSPFAAGLRWNWIAEAARAVGRGLIVIGATEAEAAKHPTVSRFMQPGWDWRGRLPAEEVLSLLGSAPLVLAPFVDGLTGRRTSACAALSAGARVLSSSGHLFDPFFRQAAAIAVREGDFAERATKLSIDPDTPEARASRVDWYQRNLEPRMLDQRLCDVLLGKTAAST